jgi:proline dehydrogenase
MTGRWWQSAMIALARSPRVKAFMQTSRSASFLARKYVAGETPAEGAACARRLLDEEGLRSSLSYLGEYVDTPELVAENVASKIAVARALRAAALDVHRRASVSEMRLRAATVELDFVNPARASRDLLA